MSRAFVLVFESCDIGSRVQRSRFRGVEEPVESEGRE